MDLCMKNKVAQRGAAQSGSEAPTLWRRVRSRRPVNYRFVNHYIAPGGRLRMRNCGAAGLFHLGQNTFAGNHRVAAGQWPWRQRIVAHGLRQLGAGEPFNLPGIQDRMTGGKFP